MRKPLYPLVPVLLILYAPESWAYLDPGTGSILLQGLIAGVASALAFGGILWKRIKGFFTTNHKSDAPEQKPESE
jgi:hypothetical protein